MNLKKILLPFTLAAAISGGVIVASVVPSLAEGTVPESVQTGIDNSIATVSALDKLALAALVVALTPMGAMLTLRFLNMVLSRV